MPWGNGGNMPWGNGGNMPWGNNGYAPVQGYQMPMQPRMMPQQRPRAMAGSGLSFEQQQAQMDKMRKQFEAMAQQIAAKQKALTEAHNKAQAAAKAAPVPAPAVEKK